LNGFDYIIFTPYYQDKFLKLFHYPKSKISFMKTKHLFITLFLILVGPLSIFAQKKQKKTDSTDQKLTVTVETKDGSRFVGKFIERRADTVVLQTEAMGLIYLAESKIKSIDEVGKNKEGSNKNKAWFRNPFATQGLFFPTGLGLKKGEGNYQNLMLGLNSVQYGITDYFSLGGGLEILSLISTGSPAVVYIQPKLSYSLSNNWHVSGGVYLFTSGRNFSSNSGIVALPFANLTYGNRDNNITVGTYVSTQGGQGGKLFLIGGQIRTVRQFSLISELYFIDDSTLINLGGRYISESLVSINFGLFRSIMSGGSFGGIPYIGVTASFGSRKK
jgi:hypothetical protein